MAGFLLCMGLAGLLVFFAKKKTVYSQRCYIGISFQFLYVAIAFFFTEIKDERRLPDYFTSIVAGKYFIATLDEAPRGGNGKYRSPVSVTSVMAGDQPVSARGKCYLYFNGDINAARLKTGDRIFFSGVPAEIPPPANPGQYDFRRRSSIHRIYHRVYLKHQDWKKLEPEKRLNVRSFSADLRNRFLSVYRYAGISGQEYAVLSALVLGYDDEIDSGIMQAFSASGTLHILSVSGMHVGIIFSALSALLIFMERRKSLRFPRLIILIVALWFYAFLTGLSPSVIRSSMMFSFIIIGQSLNRTYNIYNSLSMSALCIFIFFDPLMLFDVGLQLSFIAVAGIAFLYPKIYQLFTFEQKLLDKTWALIAVSIAAQAATFPVSIFYFHQFPNYFILANLIIIPLSTVGIFSGIFLLFLQPIPILFDGLAWFTGNVIFLLNRSAILFHDLPGSVWGGISITFFQMVLIYILFAMVLMFLGRKAVLYLKLSMTFLIVIFLCFIIEHHRQSRIKNLIVFSNTSEFCCQLNVGYSSWLIYHDVDSVKAIRYSDDLCLSMGQSPSKRTIVSLDQEEGQKKYGSIYICGKFILIDKFLLIDNPVLSEAKLFSKVIRPDAVYMDAKKLTEEFMASLAASKIIVNDRTGKAGVVDDIFNLKNGAFKIDL